MNNAPGERAAAMAMGTWLFASVAAAALAGIHPALGFAAAGAGGVVFGLLSALRVHDRQARIRRQRGRAEGGP